MKTRKEKDDEEEDLAIYMFDGMYKETCLSSWFDSHLPRFSLHYFIDLLPKLLYSLLIFSKLLFFFMRFQIPFLNYAIPNYFFVTIPNKKYFFFF